jgi:hypothetical protein
MVSGAFAPLGSLAMDLTKRLCTTAAGLCVALLACSPATSLAAGPDAIPAKAKKAKPKCKKGYVRKGSKCTKKKAAVLTVPADGFYTGTNNIEVTVATASGKRSVSVRARIPLTCPSGPAVMAGFLVRSMPLTGTTFTGQSPSDPDFGQTTMSGTFASAKSLHLTVQTANYKNGSDLCTGQLDVTTALHAGP